MACFNSFKHMIQATFILNYFRMNFVKFFLSSVDVFIIDLVLELRHVGQHHHTT
jgi:hypothetical protein